MTGAPDWKARPERPEYDEVRKRVVDSAEGIVLEEGISALRLESVAENAGLHRSSVYRYFNNKEELVTALVVKASLRLGRRVIAKLGGHAPPERFLGEGIALALAEMPNEPVLRALMDLSASERMTRIAGNALTEGIRPLVEPMFVAAAEKGALREGVTPDQALQWLQIMATGLVRSPTIYPDTDELTDLLELMLVPALLNRA